LDPSIQFFGNKATRLDKHQARHPRKRAKRGARRAKERDQVKSQSGIKHSIAMYVRLVASEEACTELRIVLCH
jgi:hypothetical protein